MVGQEDTCPECCGYADGGKVQKPKDQQPGPISKEEAEKFRLGARFSEGGEVPEELETVSAGDILREIMSKRRQATEQAEVDSRRPSNILDEVRAQHEGAGYSEGGEVEDDRHEHYEGMQELVEAPMPQDDKVSLKHILEMVRKAHTMSTEQSEPEGYMDGGVVEDQQDQNYDGDSIENFLSDPVSEDEELEEREPQLTTSIIKAMRMKRLKNRD
jgi:hypothetical protein